MLHLFLLIDHKSPFKVLNYLDYQYSYYINMYIYICVCIHIYSCIWEIAENQWYIRYKSWEYLFSNAWWLDLDIKNDIFDTLKSEVTSHRYISFPPKSYKSLINIFLFHLQIPNEIFSTYLFPTLSKNLESWNISPIILT